MGKGVVPPTPPDPLPWEPHFLRRRVPSAGCLPPGPFPWLKALFSLSPPDLPREMELKHLLLQGSFPGSLGPALVTH